MALTLEMILCNAPFKEERDDTFTLGIAEDPKIVQEEVLHLKKYVFSL